MTSKNRQTSKVQRPTSPLFTRKQPVVPLRGVHLDLKGLPPTPRRLLELLDLFVALRLNIVLVEWEDTFPWRRYPELKGPTAYKRTEIQAFTRRAARLGIRVIPLIQCLGHMENVLAKPRFKSLRENANDPSELCPSKPQSAQLVISLIDEVLTLHRPEWFHIGGDEAWHMGSCPLCRKAVKSMGKDQLYLKHVAPILEHLNKKGIRPILWDDMMRKWSAPALKKLGRQADLMAWSYNAEPVVKANGFLHEKELARYRRSALPLWAGSCFRGAGNPYFDLPKLEVLAKNNLNWVNFVRKYNMRGMISTGWGRYNTFMSPCEGLEASLHSLVLAAVAMWDNRLPREKDRTEAAFDFLQGHKQGKEWRRFNRCHQAASQLADWQQGPISYLLSQQERAAHLNGEPKRINPALFKKQDREIQDELKKGKKIGADFIRAHKGLVADHWLELYVKSRLMRFERAQQALR